MLPKGFCPGAEFLSRNFEISVGEKKIDRSEGLGEIDHFTLDGAMDYLLMPERVKALEGKIDAVANSLEGLLQLLRGANQGNTEYPRSKKAM